MSHLSAGMNGSNGGTDINSGDLMNSVSMQHILNSSLSTNGSSRRHTNNNININDELLLDELNSTMNSVSIDMPPPPPKPPKTAVLKLKFNQPQSVESGNGVVVGSVGGGDAGSGIEVGGSSQSTDDLVKPLSSAAPLDTSTHKSSNSLNSTTMQFRYLSAKTTSDSILNRVGYFIYFFMVIHFGFELIISLIKNKK